MGDWLLVCDIKKSYLKEKIGTATTTITPLGTGTVLADNAQYVFYFYNDGIYNTVDVVESAKLYNDVPHLAKAQSVVDGNRLVYGNVVTGQTADIEPEIQLTSGHPTTSAVISPGVQTNLNWQMRTRGEWTDSTSDFWGNRYRRYNTVHELRFQIDPVCPGGIGQYNISFVDFFTQATQTQNQHAGWDCRRSVGCAISSCFPGYQSPPYSSTFGAAIDIALDMASDLNGASSGQWNLNNIQGTRVSWIGINSDNFLNTSFGASWNAYTEGGVAWLEFQVTSQGPERFKYGGPSFSGSWAASSGSTGDAWSTSSNYQQQTIQWGRNTDQGAAPRVRGYVFSGFPTGMGNTLAGSGGSGGFSISMNGTALGTPDVIIVGGNEDMGIQDVISQDRGLLEQARIRAIGGMGGIRATSELICPTAGPAIAGTPTFKNGARHRFGIVYYDRALRSSSVQLASQSEVYIPRASEPTTLDPNGWGGEWYIDWQINHEAPDWAEYWQWVYGGNTLTTDYVQFVCNGIHEGSQCDYDIGLGNPRDGKDFDVNIRDEWAKQKGAAQGGNYSQNYLVDMTPLNNYVMEEGGDPCVYTFEEGDMLRIVADANDNPAINESWEFKILGVVGQGRFPHIDWDTSAAPWNPDGQYKELLVLSLESSLTALFGGGATTIMQDYTMEVYSPKKKTDEGLQIYYEFGHFGRCNIVNGVNCHMQITEDVTAGSPTQSQDFSNGIPAMGRFTRGDAFYRLRATKSNKLFTTMESFHFSDIYTSNYWDNGRPNAVLEDFRRTRKHSTVLYSEPYVPNTYINGLHSFFADVSFQEFERTYNSIQHLHSKDNALIIFQEDKTSKALVKRDILYNVDGSGNVATADTVISQAVPYLGDFGICKNPESFASHGLRMYFVDVRRGAVLRLSQDGFTVISENQMKEYFTDLCESIVGINKTTPYNIYGVWDTRFNEYIISFQEYSGNIVIPPTTGPVASMKLRKSIETFNKGNPEYIADQLNLRKTDVGDDTHSLNSVTIIQNRKKFEEEEEFRLTKGNYVGPETQA